jgi:hypothetical protein
VAVSALAAPVAVGAFAAPTAGGASVAVGGAESGTARAARVVRLQEHGRLRLYSERGATLIERGTAYGTYTARMVVDLTIHSKSVSATVAVYPRGGSITASATATYEIVRNLGYFGGSLNLGRGSGHYRHIAEVHHKSLGISGVINRYNFEVEVKADGEVAGI